MKSHHHFPVFTALFICLILNTSCGGGKQEQVTEDTVKNEVSTSTVSGVPSDSIPTPAPPPEQVDSFAKTREMLQGTWKSLEDPRSLLKYAGNKQIELYGKKVLDTLDYTLSNVNCDTKDKRKAAPGDIYILAKSSQNFDFCYLIQKLDNQSLILIYKTRKSTLKFKKVQ